MSRQSITHFVYFSPDVKVSEEQSDKSGTDPEDSEENFNAPEISDFHHYEEIFRPRVRELNRTPEPDEFPAPENSEPESLPFVPPVSEGPPQVLQRPAHLKVKKSSKKPSPSPTRRSSQPAGPGYSGSPVRIRKGSNPTTPTSAGIRPIYETQPQQPMASPTRYTYKIILISRYFIFTDFFVIFPRTFFGEYK